METEEIRLMQQKKMDEEEGKEEGDEEGKDRKETQEE